MQCSSTDLKTERAVVRSYYYYYLLINYVLFTNYSNGSISSSQP
jgi:hypothetical protein